MNPHLITWEVLYYDRQTLRENDGVRYDQIPRSGVQAIALRSAETAGQVLVLPVDGNPNFFYRRRTQMIQGGPSKVVYLLGLYPGFCLRFDPTLETVTQVDVDIDPLDCEPFAA